MPRRDGPRRLGTRKGSRTLFSRARAQTGAAAVELALILPLLLMLVFGIVTGGMSLTNAIGLSNAVREGARFGATNHPSGASLPYDSNQWTTWATDTIARVRGTQFDDGNSQTAICVDMYKVGTGTIGGSAMCNQGNGSVTPALSTSDAPPVSTSNIAAGTCVVRVWAARKFTINLVVAPVEVGRMQPSSVSRYELRTTETCP